jgi:hypothetical protein
MAIVQIRNIHPSQAASLGSAETSNGLITRTYNGLDRFTFESTRKGTSRTLMMPLAAELR